MCVVRGAVLKTVGQFLTKLPITLRMWLGGRGGTGLEGH